MKINLRRAFANIIRNILSSKEKLFHHPKYLMSGLRVLLHNVDELPFKSSQLHYAPYFEKIHFVVTPVITRIDDSLIHFTPEE